MKAMSAGVVAAALGAAALAGAWCWPAVHAQQAPGREPVRKAQIDQWKKELSNWGRWGERRSVGALNLITAAKRKQAAALVKEGVSVSMAPTPTPKRPIDNPNPYEHRMLGARVATTSASPHGVGAHAPRLARAHQLRRRVLQRLQPDAERSSDRTATRRIRSSISRTASSRAGS